MNIKYQWCERKFYLYEGANSITLTAIEVGKVFESMFVFLIPQSSKVIQKRTDNYQGIHKISPLLLKQFGIYEACRGRTNGGFCPVSTISPPYTI